MIHCIIPIMHCPSMHIRHATLLRMPAPGAATTLALLLMAILATLPIPPQTATAQNLTIRAGYLVDVERGTALPDQKILVRDGIIANVEPWRDAENPVAGERVLDLTDRYVMPGLFDTHTHMSLVVDRKKDGGNFFVTSLLDNTPYRAIQGVANARDMLAAGFTTIRDVGNSGNYGDTALKTAIAEGLVPGPTMLTAGRIIAPFGGQFFLQPEKKALGEPEYFYADTPGEIVKAVRENLHFGADFIKIVVDDQRYIYSIDEIKLFVEEARRAGTYVSAHCWTEQGARNAIAAGVHTIEHGPYMSNDVLEAAREAGVWIVGTEFTVEGLSQSFTGDDFSAIEAEHEAFVDRLRRAHALGVPYVFGSDIVYAKEGETRSSLTFTILENFRKAGISPVDQLRAMTVNASRMMGLEGKRGLIKEGWAADIVAMPSNPLTDTRALEAIDVVIKDGRITPQAETEPKY